MESTKFLDTEEYSVEVKAAGVTLEGNLGIPRNPRGVVLFAHGSGSSRHSPRNRFVADLLRESGLATLLLDLLTPAEESMDERTARLRFDIDLLAERLVGASDWLTHYERTERLPIGYFGASTGAAAALVAAVERPDQVSAIVSRGGRPDLAGERLAAVRAATLLIVGGADRAIIPLNRAALERLGTPEKQLVIVPEATHLFEEPGALEQVAYLAANWFVQHLNPPLAHSEN